VWLKVRVLPLEPSFASTCVLSELRITKPSGLQQLTTRLGLDAAEVMAFGDGDNDVPMFEWAGASFAMAHGWPSALQTATHITVAGPLETAFARGVNHAFQSGLMSKANS
jgi:hydroxymethylpyrimidine pyrophosphatase-like HAD family hydrolase